MTKSVRIENADTSAQYKVVVETWNKNSDGQWELKSSDLLSCPTEMKTFLLHDGQRFVVREKNSNDPPLPL